MPRHLTATRRAAVGGLALAALLAPPARARVPADQPGTQPAPATDVPTPTITRAVEHGFDWASAGIGAGGAGVVLLVTAAGATARSRRHRPPGVAG